MLRAHRDPLAGFELVTNVRGTRRIIPDLDNRERGIERFHLRKEGREDFLCHSLAVENCG